MRHRNARPLAVAVLALAVSISFGGLPADRSLYEEGRRAVLERRWEAASVVFERLLAAHPDSAYLDDALYWYAYSRAESGECELAYEKLRSLEERFPESHRAVAGHALRVRCAGALLITEPDHPSADEFSILISGTTDERHSTMARLAAVEVLLSTDPVEAARALQTLAGEVEDSSLLEVTLDRHFGGKWAIARPADPAFRLGAANAVVLVRQPDGVAALSLAQALHATAGEAGAAYPERVRADIHEALLDVRQASIRPQKPGRRERSQVVQIEDMEVHLYHRGNEAVRILVLNREHGYESDNVRIFVERDGRLTDLAVADAEKMAEEGNTRVLGRGALTFVGSSLALIKLDLGATAAVTLGPGPKPPPITKTGFRPDGTHN
ncbi:MAG: tetratricopeptide repeat protein [Acidobacteriota bacterium]|nr:hypothetical protein [Acidobacteriota bacterium]